VKKQFYVYIMTNVSRTLYIGFTNNLERRVHEHREKQSRDSFTRQYNVTMLAYFEEFDSSLEAIAREKQIKKWSKPKKMGLVERMNPDWIDLSAGW
jgi:putative endonuclease